MWDPIGGMSPLGELAGGGFFSEAWAINNKNWIVGRSDSAIGQEAVLWHPVEGIVALNTRLGGTGAGWTLRQAFDVILTRSGLVDDEGRTLWRPGFQVLRACCEKDFLGLGLSEYLYCRAIGHSPAVSRAYYLAKFEGATLEEDARNEFKAAAARVRRDLEITETDASGDTAGIHEESTEEVLETGLT